MYLGFPVLELRELQPTGVDVEPNSEIFGPIEFEQQLHQFGPTEDLIRVEAEIRGRAELKTLRDHWNDRKGAWGPFWIHSAARFWTVAEAAPGGSATLKVLWRNQPFGLDCVTRHIYDKCNGSFHRTFDHERDPINPDWLRFSVDPVTSGPLSPGDALEYAWLVRFQDDRLTVAQIPRRPGVFVADLIFKELQRETPTS